ncbi:cartilage intermediate layer protein 2-like [Osmerus mordax]|uniref:cartilage intermediate layer protein 2-like n=1 Tax=Osmerus mordax TaxID=8014 RepID=UPI00350FCE1A
MTKNYFFFLQSSVIRAVLLRILSQHQIISAPCSGIENNNSTNPCYYPVDIQCWTDWFDRDDPTGYGDFETLVDLRSEYPGKICPSPVQIEVTTINGVSHTATGNVFAAVDTTTGFVCNNRDQRPGTSCEDYRVRFSCHPPFCGLGVCWSKWYDSDNPSGTGDWELLSGLQKAYPGSICAHPLYLESVTVDTNTPALSTGQNFKIYNPTQGVVCRNEDQEVRCCRDYKVRFGCPCCPSHCCSGECPCGPT